MTRATPLLLVCLACAPEVPLLLGAPTCPTGICPEVCRERAPESTVSRPQLDDDGFSCLAPQLDSHVVFVSNDGDDRNSGQTPAGAVRSIARGLTLLRDGSPDWLLLRRGDSFAETFGTWSLSGRSNEAPMVLGAFGTSPDPPRLLTGVDSALVADRVNVHDLVIAGIEIVADGRDLGPPNDGPRPMVWTAGAQRIRIEDVAVRYFASTGITFVATSAPVSDVQLYRVRMLDTFGIGGPLAVYVDGAANVTISQCLIDEVGYHDFAGNGGAPYGHGVTVTTRSAASFELADSFFLQTASHGARLGSGGLLHGNVFWRNAVGAVIGDSDDPLFGLIDAEVRDNLVLEGQNIWPRLQPAGALNRGWGIDMANIRTITVADNIVSSCAVSACRSIIPNGSATLQNNVVWRWPQGDGIPQTAGPYSDPNRSIPTYMASIGEAATADAFIDALREQRKGNWRPELEAAAVRRYFREGFAAP